MPAGEENRVGEGVRAARRGRWAASSSRGIVSLVVVGAMLVVSVAALVGTGHSRAVLDVFDGRTWLWSSGEGEMASVNGSSGRVEVRVRVGDDVVTVAQDGSHLLFTDAEGVVSSLDLSSYEVRSSAYGGGTALEIVLGEAAAFLVDAAAGSVQAIDPATTNPVGDALALGGGLSVGSVDDDDLLWIGQRASGTAVAVGTSSAGAAAEHRVQVAEPEDVMHVSVADDQPVVVNATTAEVVRLDGEEIADRFALGIPPGADVLVAGENEDGSVPVAVPEENDLVLVDAERAQRFDLGSGDADLGEPVRFSGRSYVPDYGASVVLEVDDTGEITNRIDVPGGEGGFELFRDDDHLWANAPGDPSARSIDEDGKVVIVEKYDPDVPVTDPLPDPTVPPDAPPTPVNPLPTPGAGPESPLPGGAGPPGSVPGVGPTVPDRTGPAPPRTPDPDPDPDPDPPAPPDPETASAPGQPLSFDGAPGNRAVTLSWTAPDDNGAPITSYDLAWSDDAGDDGNVTIEADDVGATGGISVEVTEGGVADIALRNGRSYTFRLAAVNEEGAGAAAETGPHMPTSEVPEPPSEVIADHAIEGDQGVVTLTWPPADPENHVITGYTVFVDAPGGRTQLDGLTSPARLVVGTDVPATADDVGYAVQTVAASGAVSAEVASNSAPAFGPPVGVGATTVRTQDGVRSFRLDTTPQWLGREGWVRISGPWTGDLAPGAVSTPVFSVGWGDTSVGYQACVTDDDGREHCSPPQSATASAPQPYLEGQPVFRPGGCTTDPNRPGANSWGREYSYHQIVRTNGVPHRFFTGYGFTWTYWRGGNSGSAVTNNYDTWSGRTIDGDGEIFVHGGWGQDTDRYFVEAWVSVDGLPLRSQGRSDNVLADCGEDGPGRGT